MDEAYVFLTFVLQLKKTPEEISTRKTDPTGIKPGPARCEATMLPLNHSGGLEVYSAADTSLVHPRASISYPQARSCYCG